MVTRYAGSFPCPAATGFPCGQGSADLPLSCIGRPDRGAEVDSFSLYCLATEVRPTEALRVLGLIEARLARDPDDAENRLYKGALLARMSLGMPDTDQADRFLAAGVKTMRAAQPAAPGSSLACLRMLYARATTQVLLPRPPMTGKEVEKCLSDLMSHPRFGQLDPRRRAVALAHAGASGPR